MTVGNYNRFGATYTQVIAHYPKTVAADYDPAVTGVAGAGQTEIESVMDRIARQVAAILMPRVFKQLTTVDAEMPVEYATDGQTTFTLGMKPVTAGTLHLWRYPSLATMESSRSSGFARETNPNLGRYDRAPVLGYWEVDTTTYSVVLATGVVTLTQALSLGERVFASYRVDVDNAAFAVSSLADAVTLGCAAFLGARLYSESTQKWDLAKAYIDQWAGLMKAMAEGGVIPDEIRRLKYFQEVERTSNQWGSVDMRRG